MAPQSCRILLADGRKISREGLRALLERHSGMEVVGEADDVRDVPRLLRALRVEVVVLNVALSTRRAAEAVRQIVLERRSARVIVLPTMGDLAFAREVLAAGAKGCLTRESASDELLMAVRTVAKGGIYVSPALSEALVSGYILAEHPSTGVKPSRKRLSERERAILERIADGATTKEIAYDLGVSSKTIETHRRRIMGKVGVYSIAELTKYAVREGLTSLEGAN